MTLGRLSPVLSILPFTCAVMETVVRPGDWVLDATAGNGHDTCLLAGLVGETGRVFAFDRQPDAIAATRERLVGLGLQDRVRLFATGHERLGETLDALPGPDAAGGLLAAAMFNLGYLPGGDRRLVTRPETTIAALDQVWDRLAPCGVITVVQYPGHPGGDDEVAAVRAWAAPRIPRLARVLLYQFLDPRTPSPVLSVIEKKSRSAKSLQAHSC